MVKISLSVNVTLDDDGKVVSTHWWNAENEVTAKLLACVSEGKDGKSIVIYLDTLD